MRFNYSSVYISWTSSFVILDLAAFPQETRRGNSSQGKCERCAVSWGVSKLLTLEVDVGSGETINFVDADEEADIDGSLRGVGRV